MEKTLAILEGDGIGPEIVREAVKVLKAVEQKYGHRFILKYAPFGAQAYFDEGSPFPEKTREICDSADVIIKGPVGLALEEMNRIPPEHRPRSGPYSPYESAMIPSPISGRSGCRRNSPTSRPSGPRSSAMESTS